MLVNAGSWDDCLTKEGTMLYIPYVTTRTADKVHKLLYFYLSLWLKFMWLLLIQLLLPNHSTICPSSCLFLLLNLSVTFLIDIYEQRCCVHTTNFCLCVIQKKGLTLVMYCSGYVGEDGVGVTCPKKTCIKSCKWHSCSYQQQILNICKPYEISCMQCWRKTPSEKMEFL